MQTPDEALELVRARVRVGDLRGARDVVITGLHGQRAALSIALAERRIGDALEIAVGLADTGWWDPEVAATIVAVGDDAHPRAERARAIVSVVTIARSGTIEEVAALLRESLEAGSLLESFLLGEEAARRWPERAELWAVVALTRNELRDIEGAEDALREALARAANDPFVKLVEAHVAYARDRRAGDTSVREARNLGMLGLALELIEAAGVWRAAFREIDQSR
jgi:hypothetical protein